MKRLVVLSIDLVKIYRFSRYIFCSISPQTFSEIYQNMFVISRHVCKSKIQPRYFVCKSNCANFQCVEIHICVNSILFECLIVIVFSTFLFVVFHGVGRANKYTFPTSVKVIFSSNILATRQSNSTCSRMMHRSLPLVCVTNFTYAQQFPACDEFAYAYSYCKL